MAPELDTVNAFKQNRAETWVASKPWLLLMVVSVLGGFFVGDLNGRSPTGSWLLWLVFFIMFGASIVRLIFIVRALYRCPSCGEIPMSGWASLGPSSFGYERGVDLNPSQCPNCGVNLK